MMHGDTFLGEDEIIEEKEEKEAKILEKLLSPPTNKETIQKMILEHLSEQGYFKASGAFMREVGINSGVAPLLKEREEIRLLSEEGDFLSVIERISSIFPFFFADHAVCYFQIMKQEILEDMYIRKTPEPQIILRMEKELSPIVEKHPSLLGALEELVGVVLFRRASPDQVLDMRKELFQEINKQILLLLDYEINDTLSRFIEEADEILKSSSFLSLSRESLQVDELRRKVIQRSEE
ncbi:glucose-induced degradation protein 8 [Nematocida sp. LUAm3]|nr:glucose-induced degradation protein 8 [Nematocida sp. LUAm3]KAI5176321.1 glucose-induced degradation protein 8 [Nematocida sp. LUAm2]KAI5178248.1 glucose-induced degradation protein 8 [Nematocida sp. LUAm1]